MRRRRFLGTAGAGLLAAAAGCVGGRPSDEEQSSDGGDPTPGGTDTPSPDTRTPGATATASPTPAPATDPAPGADVGLRSPDPATLRDVELPLSKSDLSRGAPKDAIPAITDPVFAEDWSDVGATLEGAERVVGVEVEGNARAYPLAVLNWHEVVNDSFGGPLLVTFCPLCGSGVTAERRVDGRETEFGVSGYLWHSDLVMYDDLTGSLWSQILGTAVRGPQTGTRLSLRPSTITTWRRWRGEHPDTEVLLPPPASNTITGERETRNYDTNPYDDYGNIERVGIGFNDSVDDRLHPKTPVVGVATDAVARAYPFPAVRDAGGVVNDRVGDLPVVVAAADNTLYAYVRRVDGETLTFSRDGDALAAGGSRWTVASGRAVDGPHEGTTLSRANDRSAMFWFAWADFFPETEIYGSGDGSSG
jgi:hypothetical protein